MIPPIRLPTPTTPTAPPLRRCNASRDLWQDVYNQWIEQLKASIDRGDLHELRAHLHDIRLQNCELFITKGSFQPCLIPCICKGDWNVVWTVITTIKEDAELSGFITPPITICEAICLLMIHGTAQYEAFLTHSNLSKATIETEITNLLVSLPLELNTWLSRHLPVLPH